MLQFIFALPVTCDMCNGVIFHHHVPRIQDISYDIIKAVSSSLSHGGYVRQKVRSVGRLVLNLQLSEFPFKALSIDGWKCILKV